MPSIINNKNQVFKKIEILENGMLSGFDFYMLVEREYCELLIDSSTRATHVISFSCRLKDDEGKFWWDDEDIINSLMNWINLYAVIYLHAEDFRCSKGELRNFLRKCYNRYLDLEKNLLENLDINTRYHICPKKFVSN
jgi:hypothetical protein